MKPERQKILCPRCRSVNVAPYEMVVRVVRFFAKNRGKKDPPEWVCRVCKYEWGQRYAYYY